MQNDVVERVAAVIKSGAYPSQAARAIIPMVLEEAAKAVENQRPVHHSFVRRTHAAAAVRAILQAKEPTYGK